MKGLGMNLRPDGAPNQSQHRVHIDGLWEEFVTFSQNRGGMKYTLFVTSTNNPFFDWKIGQRYCHRNDITSEMLIWHKNGAKLTSS